MAHGTRNRGGEKELKVGILFSSYLGHLNSSKRTSESLMQTFQLIAPEGQELMRLSLTALRDPETAREGIAYDVGKTAWILLRELSRDEQVEGYSELIAKIADSSSQTSIENKLLVQEVINMIISMIRSDYVKERVEKLLQGMRI